MTILPRLRLRLTLACCLGAAPTLAAQAPLTRKLGAPEVESAEPFTSVTSLRELHDGRVLVSDRRDRSVQLIDLRAGKASRVGREGNGPGEYALPLGLVALPGDSTLLYDGINSRLLLILPDGSPGPVLRLPESMNPVAVGAPRRADARGNFYYEVERRGKPGERYAGSAADLLRFNRVTDRVDTLATLALPAGRFEGARALPNGMLLRFTNKPLAPSDVAAVGADGRVAIVRAKDYHVEWFAPDGTRLTGPPIPYEPVKITEAERQAFLKSQTRPGSIIVQGGGGSGAGGSAPRAAPVPGGDPFAREPVDWPERKPAFLSGAAAVAPDGRLWVLRTGPHDDPLSRYDVIDAGGRLVERITLPAHTRLVGFGAGVVYLVRIDADDLEWLGRYRL